jgi:hypothetical protein
MSLFTFIDLFAGIGGTRLAFENVGGKCVFSCEIDKFAQKTYFANFGEIPVSDITKVDENSVPDHDILLAGFPCQPFSISGVSKLKSLNIPHGFENETKGTLFFDIARILNAKKPNAFLLENVKNLQHHDKGKTVLVQGSVIDIAAGTEQAEQAARFPNGVPAVSDESMGDWMEYVYMQKPKPTDVTGVEVIISVFDPNDNYYEVGRTTSDTSGFFSCDFVPEVPGKYTVIATFEGSESYWPSHAETAAYVEEAPAATPEPTPMSTSTADLYLVPGIVGIIIAIAVVGAILMLMLRKR